MLPYRRTSRIAHRSGSAATTSPGPAAARRGLVVLITAVGLHPLVALAADGTWITPADGSWSNAANWAASSIADGPGATADFSTLDLTASATVTLDTPRTLANLTFGDTDPSSPASWTLSDGGTGSVLTLAGPAAPVITVNALGAGSTVTLNTVLAGNQGFTKAGDGTLVLTATNTYTGPTTLSAGTLSISADSNVSSSLNFNGGTLQITGSGLNNLDAHTVNWSSFNGGIDNQTATPLTISNTIAGAGSFTKAGSGTVTLTGNNSYAGGTTIAAGTLQIGDGVTPADHLGA